MQLPRLSLAQTLLPAAIIGIPVATLAQNGDPIFTIGPHGGASSLTPQSAGLRSDRGNIVSAFSGQLTEFLGDCPGQEWLGPIANANVRFISYAVPPSKDLRVELVNLTNGERLKKKYTQEGYGSSTFDVLKLGQGSGRQEIQYTIYNRVTDTVREQGSFSYDLMTTISSSRRDGEWKSELFCASDDRALMKDCEKIGGRQRLYCDGNKTETVRGESETLPWLSEPQS